MSDHEALRQESPDTQRKRIEAMAQDPEMQQVAATARPRGPERSPQPDTSDKQMMQHRLATMAEVAERDPKIEQRIKEREQARDNRAAAKQPRRRSARPNAEADGQQVFPVSAQWDDRQHVNLPAPLANTDHVVPRRELYEGQIALPFDYDLLQHAAAEPPATEPRFEVGYLPGMEPGPSKVPCALLDLFGSAPSRGHGGPVPVWGRMGWEALLAPEPGDYQRRTADLEIGCGNMSALVWPTTDYKPSRHGPLLLEGAQMLNDPTSAVRWRGSARAARILLVMVYMPPEVPYDRDGRIGFYVTRPEGSQQGPQVDTSLLRYLRAKGWRLHRIMVTGYCLWDRYATVNGRLVPLTVPAKVRTDAAGYAVSATGRVLLDSKGRPTRSTTHPRAVQIGTGRVQHLNLDQHYPWLEGSDLFLLGHRTVGATPAQRNNQRKLVLRGLNTMCEVEWLDFETRYRNVRGGRELDAVRLLPSVEHRKAHAARWAARKYSK